MENSQGESSQPKLPKLKIFQRIQTNLSAIGIGPGSSVPVRSFNRKILAAFLSLGLYIFCTLMHIFTEVKNFLDLTESTYECSVFILISFILLAMLFNANKLFEAIDDCECIVNSSKWPNKQLEASTAISNDFLSII